MLTIHDIDASDLAGLPGRHTAPISTTVIGVVTTAAYDPELAAWSIELLAGGGDGAILGTDLDGQAISDAGAATWRPGQIASVTLGDWAGRPLATAAQGCTLDDVLALPAAHDHDWARIVEVVELATI